MMEIGREFIEDGGEVYELPFFVPSNEFELDNLVSDSPVRCFHRYEDDGKFSSCFQGNSHLGLIDPFAGEGIRELILQDYCLLGDEFVPLDRVVAFYLLSNLSSIRREYNITSRGLLVNRMKAVIQGPDDEYSSIFITQRNVLRSLNMWRKPGLEG